jgi:hypothetical protein
MRKPKRNEPSEAGSARPYCEQDFLAEGILELLELQRRFTLIAQDFENSRTALFRDLDAAILQMNDVHLQRFDLKVAVVAAVRTSQRHHDSPLNPFWV